MQGNNLIDMRSVEEILKGKSLYDLEFGDELFHAWDALTESGSNLQMVRQLCLWDRYFLLVQIFGRIDALHPWIYARCRETERDPDDHLDLWAREHYKSTVITYAGVIQELLRDPNITIGIFSHTAPIAKSFLKQIRMELQRNEKLKRLFPDILYNNPEGESPSWSLDNGIIVKRSSNPKEATVEAHGLVDGMPTSKHFALRVYDDIVVKESTSTPEQVSKTTEAWELSDNLGTQNGRKWHVGTRWSYADTYEDILSRGVLKVRLHPATDDGTFIGNPVLWSQEVNDQKKILQGEATYSCQNLQNPLAGQNRFFDSDDLQAYEVRPDTLNVYILCDPARSNKKESAKTAFVVMGIDYAANKYVLDGFNHKMDLKERWERMAQLYVRWRSAPGVQRCYVGYEAFGAQADLDYFLEQQRMGNNPKFPIEELKWPREGGGSKEDRVQRLGPDLRSHKLFLPFSTQDGSLTKAQRNMLDSGYQHRISRPIKRKDENNNIYDLGEELKTQFKYFPFGKYKDVIDAMSRIYDMEPKTPTYREPSYLEPEFI